MLVHPDMLLTMVNDRHRELVEEADRRHLHASARDARRARRPEKNTPVRGHPARAVVAAR